MTSTRTAFGSILRLLAVGCVAYFYWDRWWAKALLFLFIGIETINMSLVYLLPRFIKKQLQQVEHLMQQMQARAEESRDADTLEGEIVVDNKRLPPAP
jgi:hypothetical protein